MLRASLYCICLRKMSLSIVVSFSRTVPATECALDVDSACRTTACEDHNLLEPDPPANYHLHLLPLRGETECAVERDERHFHLTRGRSERTVREYVREEPETHSSKHARVGFGYISSWGERPIKVQYTQHGSGGHRLPTPAETLTPSVFDSRLACGNETLRSVSYTHLTLPTIYSV